jgi:hypothetical protein
MKSLRPRIIQTNTEYSEWIASIGKEDQICLMQEFHPASRIILDINKEYWSYKYFRVCRGKDEKLYGWERYEPKPLRRNGQLCYYGGEDNEENKYLWGDVFAARIVPLHPEILPEITWKEWQNLSSGNAWAETDLPLYEPKWCGDRIFLMTNRRGYDKSERKLLEKFLGYSKEINQGRLLTLFPGEHADIWDFEEWWKENGKDYPEFTFLYSEPVLP